MIKQHMRNQLLVIEVQLLSLLLLLIFYPSFESEQPDY